MDKEYGKRSYEEGHIKGAKRVDIEKDLSSVVKAHGGRHPIPSIEELKSTFENIGINDDSIVISYDEGDLSGASRLNLQSTITNFSLFKLSINHFAFTKLLIILLLNIDFYYFSPFLTYYTFDMEILKLIRYIFRRTSQ